MEKKKMIFIFTVICIIALGVIFVFFKKQGVKNGTDFSLANQEGVGVINVDPVSHASLILGWDDSYFYFDPASPKEMYKNKPEPDLIFLTDLHQDHLNIDTLFNIVRESTTIIAPQAVYDELPIALQLKSIVMNNDEKNGWNGYGIEAVPMYNLPGDSEKFHTKGRGNGYILEKDGAKIYVSGDSADTPEMRNLKDIDMAFVAMNLPYTMSVEDAASAVLDFKPKKVFPYHYRTPEGFSDIAKFKQIIDASGSEIEVVQMNWYPEVSEE